MMAHTTFIVLIGVHLINGQGKGLYLSQILF